MKPIPPDLGARIIRLARIAAAAHGEVEKNYIGFGWPPSTGRADAGAFTDDSPSKSGGVIDLRRTAAGKDPARSFVD